MKNNNISLNYSFSNELISLFFYLIALIFLVFAAIETKDWFAIFGVGMSFGFFINQFNLIGRIIVKQYFDHYFDEWKENN